ncbi:MAG TPA: 3D domain-containing protein [Clostridia bacterium]|nr:3D domain-containing protein [Clostridia bacterium]
MLPLAKNIKRLFSYRKRLLVIILAVTVSAGAGCGAFAMLKKDVVINDNGKVITCMTMKNTFKETLEQNDIVVNAFDYISIPLETNLQRMRLNEIYIKRAVPVFITADGKQTRLMTYRDTVGEMLKDSPVRPEGSDRLEGAQQTDLVKSDMKLRIVRIDESIVSEKEDIPYLVQKKANKTLDEGAQRIVQKGKPGVLEKQYTVVTEDGKEVSRQLLKETVLQDPIKLIVEFGTVMNFKTSRGDTVRYSKVIDMRATAYTSSFEETGKAPGHPLYGITASGVKARKGVIAVDPRVIPLGTRLYVELPGKTPDYGYAVAADVGGGIKGNRVDLYYENKADAMNFGRRKVKVYILSEN